MTARELEALLSLIGDARHVVIGTALDPASRADGSFSASRAGGSGAGHADAPSVPRPVSAVTASVAAVSARTENVSPVRTAKRVTRMLARTGSVISSPTIVVRTTQRHANKPAPKT